MFGLLKLFKSLEKPKVQHSSNTNTIFYQLQATLFYQQQWPSFLYVKFNCLQMSKKNIESIPSQLISKQTNRLQLKKALISTKFNWLAKYLSKENQEDSDSQQYLMTSIKVQPQKRRYTRKHPLKENREICNRSVDPTANNSNKITIQHKLSHIKSRLFTEHIENNGLKTRKGRNSSLLLNCNNSRQTFNFIDNTDMRRMGQHLKTDLDIYKRRHKKYEKLAICIDHQKISPWNLQQDKQNLLQPQF